MKVSLFYCPRCSRNLHQSPSSGTGSAMPLYDCTICEEVYTQEEVDKWPGQSKGAQMPVNQGCTCLIYIGDNGTCPVPGHSQI